MATRRLQNAGLTNGCFHRTLNGLLMDLMAYGPSGVRIGAKRGCGEYWQPHCVAYVGFLCTSAFGRGCLRLWNL